MFVVLQASSDHWNARSIRHTVKSQKMMEGKWVISSKKKQKAEKKLVNISFNNHQKAFLNTNMSQFSAILRHNSINAFPYHKYETQLFFAVPIIFFCTVYETRFSRGFFFLRGRETVYNFLGSPHAQKMPQNLKQLDSFLFKAILKYWRQWTRVEESGGLKYIDINCCRLR